MYSMCGRDFRELSTVGHQDTENNLQVTAGPVCSSVGEMKRFDYTMKLSLKMQRWPARINEWA